MAAPADNINRPGPVNNEQPPIVPVGASDGRNWKKIVARGVLVVIAIAALSILFPPVAALVGVTGLGIKIGVAITGVVVMVGGFYVLRKKKSEASQKEINAALKEAGVNNNFANELVSLVDRDAIAATFKKAPKPEAAPAPAAPKAPAPAPAPAALALAPTGEDEELTPGALVNGMLGF